jgi:glucose/arabinose dehydrogenase
MGFVPCNTMPAATPPALKKGPAIGPFAAQAGQIVGVPGEPDVLYVIGHRNGNVYAVINGMVQQTPFVHVNIATAGNNEQGLLSMALHPNFAQNQLFYLFYTAASDGAMTIDEFKRTSKTAAGPNPTQNIYSRARADGACTSGSCFHNGGSLMFNPKDAQPYLYWSVGNNTVKGQSSSATGYAGRILRFDLGTKMSTTIAYGLRNPYRASIDRLTGDMWIGDVADAAGGSVFFKANGSAPGTNFGYSASNEIDDGISGFQGGSAALIGGFVYRGNAIPGLCGRYFFGMHDPGTVRSMIQQGGNRMGGITNHGTLSVPNKLSSFGEDGEGELYVASMGDNVIYKIIAGP